MDKLALSIGRISQILKLVAALCFISALMLAMFFLTTGMFVALGLTFCASFSMLLGSVLGERLFVEDSEKTRFEPHQFNN